MADLEFKGKTVIVTGGAGGLGLAIAQSFYQNGANVVITDVNGERLFSAPSSFDASDRDTRLLPVEADSADEAQVDDLVKKTVDRFGKLDVLVNNAAVSDDLEPVLATTTQQWERCINVNLTAPFLTTKAVIRQFLKSEDKNKGVILNVISAAGLHGYRSGTAYTASKHGLVGLTRNTAAFYGRHGIRCVGILPGAMNTPMAQSHKVEDFHQEGMKLAAGTMATGFPWSDLDEVAKTVLCLCSDGMGTVNGALVPTDNGWTAV